MCDCIIMKSLGAFSIKFANRGRFCSPSDIQSELEKEGITSANIRMVRDLSGGSILHLAIVAERIELIDYFLSLNIPINVVDKSGYNELHLLAECPIYSNSNEESKETFLSLLRIAHTLLERGIDLKQQENKYKNTPLYSLLYAGVLEFDEGIPLIKRCIDIVQDIHIKNKSGYDLIDWLKLCGNRGNEIIEYCRIKGLLSKEDEIRLKPNTDVHLNVTASSNTVTSEPAQQNDDLARYEKYRKRKITEGKTPMDAEAWLRRYGTKA